MDNGAPRIIDVHGIAANLTMFYGRMPQTTFAQRRGSAAHLGLYRDGMLLMSKSAGTGHWETHPQDELLYMLDGEMTVDILEEDGPRTFVVGAGMIGIVWPSLHGPGSVHGPVELTPRLPFLSAAAAPIIWR